MNSSELRSRLEEADPEDIGSALEDTEQDGEEDASAENIRPQKNSDPEIESDGDYVSEELEAYEVFELLGNKRRFNAVWTVFLADNLSEDVDKGDVSEVSAYLERDDVEKTSGEDQERIKDYIADASKDFKLVDRPERKRVITSLTQNSMEKLYESGALEQDDDGYLYPGPNQEDFLAAYEVAEVDVWNDEDGIINRLFSSYF